MANPLPGETVPLDKACGRILARSVVARRDQPAADLSAMDGYAVRDDDMAGPWLVVGESAAGHPAPPRLSAGKPFASHRRPAAPRPDERAGSGGLRARGDRLTLTGDGPDHPGRHIRRKGFDFAEGRR
jgi:molybdopterin molybdotransferase